MRHRHHKRSRYMYNERWANFFVRNKDYGLLIGARRPAENDSYYCASPSGFTPSTQ